MSHKANDELFEQMEEARAEQKYYDMMFSELKCDLADFLPHLTDEQIDEVYFACHVEMMERRKAAADRNQEELF